MSDETMTAEDCIAEITFAMTGRPPLFITQGGAHKALARYVQQQIERRVEAVRKPEPTSKNVAMHEAMAIVWNAALDAVTCRK